MKVNRALISMKTQADIRMFGPEITQCGDEAMICELGCEAYGEAFLKLIALILGQSALDLGKICNFPRLKSMRPFPERLSTGVSAVSLSRAVIV